MTDSPLFPLSLSFPRRPRTAHKGTFGTVLVVAGQTTMLGAPCFVAAGALRSGCGLVRLAVPGEILLTCLSLVPSAIGIIRDDVAQIVTAIDEHTVIAAGPGLGLGVSEASLMRQLLQVQRPMVLDGDALTHLSRFGPRAQRGLPASSLSNPFPLILTPHPGEYARLAATWNCPTLPDEATDCQRRAAANDLARAMQAIIVLKGHATVVSDGRQCWTCAVGNPTLAIPGSGDVLTGVIAGLLSQGMPGFEAAVLGVQVHGMAGDLCLEQRPFGMLALELAAYIPEAARRFAADGRHT